MLHYRQLLYTNEVDPDSLFMGETTLLDILQPDLSEEGVAFYRGIDTRVPAGIDLAHPFGAVMPPPIMKTVSSMAHPDYPMGVIVESLWYGIAPDQWVPYYAKVFLGHRKPHAVMFLPSINEVLRSITGDWSNQVQSTLIKGLSTCCTIPGNEDACEGVQYFEDHAPIAQTIVKVWPDTRSMIERINAAVSLMKRNRDHLSQTIIESATMDLYVPASDLPIVYRSKDLICDRFIARDPIGRLSPYIRNRSPVRIAVVTDTDRYSQKYRDVVYAIDFLPVTDLDVSFILHADHRISGVYTPCVVDRNYTLHDGWAGWDLVEGHIRHICVLLADCLTGKYDLNNPYMTLHDIYGCAWLRLFLVKDHDEMIQIRIYDSEDTLVFCLTVPSALMKLTDVMVSPSRYLGW